MIPLAGLRGYLTIAGAVAVGVLVLLLWLSHARNNRLRDDLAEANATIGELTSANASQGDAIKAQEAALQAWHDAARDHMAAADKASGEAAEFRRRLLATGPVVDTAPGCQELMATPLAGVCPALAETIRGLE